MMKKLYQFLEVRTVQSLLSRTLVLKCSIACTFPYFKICTPVHNISLSFFSGVECDSVASPVFVSA